MNTATVSPRDATSATSLLVENVRIYLQVKSAFEQCDKEIQAVVADMIAIVSDDEATPEERQRSLYTIVEALFPSLAYDFLINCERVRASKDAQAQWDDMAQEEKSFSERLESLMSEKGVTQEQLGKRIGVTQSAIANMVNRNCRPQKKTVLRIADALGVSPQDLWPAFKPE